jgi:hypothetical protein
MKNDNHVENQLIDAYYGENNGVNPDRIESATFQYKLHKSLKKMDILNNVNFEPDINIMDIISKAEALKEKDNNLREIVSFLTLCSLLMGAVFIVAFTLSSKVIIYTEVLISVLFPIIFIPVAIKIHMKEKLK